MSSTSAVPLPGSIDAQNRGCTCPVIDNHYGEGVPTPGGRQFWTTEGCPLHAPIRLQRPDQPGEQREPD